jgi:hypothetical protein
MATHLVNGKRVHRNSILTESSKKFPSPLPLPANKEVNFFSTRSKPLKVYLTILNSVEQYSKLPTLPMSKQALNKYVRRLKNEGKIKKVGYATWELERSKPLCPWDTPPVPASFPVEKVNFSKVRGHAFMFVLKVPQEVKEWNNRLASLKDHRVLPGVRGGGQHIDIKGFKVWLLRHSVVFYFPAGFDYIDVTANAIKAKAFEKVLGLVADLERLLGFSLRGVKGYGLKVSKQHYALMDNFLARQKSAANEGLRVIGFDGLEWLIIDRSLGVPELEAVNSFRSDKDTDEVLSPFFNELRDTKLTPLKILDMFRANAEQFKLYADNMISHVEAVKSLSAGVKQLSLTIEELRKEQAKNKP